MASRIFAWLLSTRWIMRLPIPMYRAGLGWLLGRRLVMVEHQGRTSGEPRYVVVEVLERTGDALWVASGFGARAQWYRNLRANGVAYLSTGRARRVRVAVTLLDEAEGRARLESYARRRPASWRMLQSALDRQPGGAGRIRIVRFSPAPGSPSR